MKLIYYLTLLLTSVFSNSVFAYTIEQDECYLIDGPANVRTTPKGEVIESIGDGNFVKVIDSKDKWFLIEYSTANLNPNCIFAGKKKRAWTYYGNLLLMPKSLKALTSSGKIIISSSHIDLSGKNSVSFLGDIYSFECDYSREQQCYLKLPLPFEISEYCLSGKNQRNRIQKVYLWYGGDDGSWTTNIKYEKPLLKGNCVVVNGTIASQISTSKPEKDTKFLDICTYCDSRKALLKTNSDFDFECTKYSGDFNKDGIGEALIHLKQLNGAPAIESFHLFQLKKQCQALELGEIHFVIRP